MHAMWGSLLLTTSPAVSVQGMPDRNTVQNIKTLSSAGFKTRFPHCCVANLVISLSAAPLCGFIIPHNTKQLLQKRVRADPSKLALGGTARAGCRDGGGVG